MNALTGQLVALWDQAVVIWLSGGWGMIALALNAFVMLALGMHVLFKLREKGFQSVSEKIWRRWIDRSTYRGVARVVNGTRTSVRLASRVRTRRNRC